LQIIMPGEVAPAHRHVASALRFIVRDAMIFSYSDRAAQEKLKLWREQREG
jgi:gentisate 1,2-dioxygenase